MLTSDADRYYTPPSIATTVARAIGDIRPKTILDSACGSGNLLDAAESVHPKVRCVGIDSDRNMIARLRRQRPDWTLFVGDALCRDTWARKIDGQLATLAEVVVLNPPFSMGAKKGGKFRVWGQEIRCSLAMAHVLSALENSQAKLAIAIVPESWAHSDMDDVGRQLLCKRYRVEMIRRLRNSTFSGARANALVIRLERLVSAIQLFSDVHLQSISSQISAPIQVIRGGLPVFEAVRTRSGVPYVHSTDIHRLVSSETTALGKVKPIARGLVSGHVVLIPRVGTPRSECIRALHLREMSQLSDCVIALRARNRKEALSVERLLLDRAVELNDLYHGTGAQYVTVSRITEWIKLSLKP
jgi:predicted RNA methylase